MEVDHPTVEIAGVTYVLVPLSEYLSMSGSEMPVIAPEPEAERFPVESPIHEEQQIPVRIETVGEKITRLRTQLGLSAEQFGELAGGMNQAQIWRLEHGQRPQRQTMERLIRAFERIEQEFGLT